MSRKIIPLFLLMAGVAAVMFTSSTQAQIFHHKKAPPAPCCNQGCGSGGGGCCVSNGCMTVNCIEYVQEQRQVCRTTYKMEQRQETVTVCKCEKVMEQQTKQVCCNRLVQETVMENRVCCERVPVWQEKTVMKQEWVTQQVTENVTKMVDRGHYECQLVPVSGNKGAAKAPGTRRLLGHHKKEEPKPSCGCCDPCACCQCCEYKQVWCPCMVCETCPVTCCKKVCVTTPCQVKVCCYQNVQKTVQVPVCHTRCVQEMKTVTCNVCVNRMVPTQCTRTVCHCVPVQEMVTVCVCVPKCVQKTIPVSSCCAPCCN